MLDLSRLSPEAARVTEQAAGVYMAHTRPWFVGLMIFLVLRK